MEHRAIQGMQLRKPAQGPKAKAGLASLQNRAIKRRPEIRRTPSVQTEPAAAAAEPAQPGKTLTVS